MVLSDVGNGPAELAFNVWNEGEGNLDYTIATDAEWLAVTPLVGTQLDLPLRHMVSFDTTSLSPGIYAAKITVSAPGATPPERCLPVVVEVRPAALFTAYNDLLWGTGQNSFHITTHTSATGGGGGDGGGELVDYATGQPAGVQLAISGGAYYGSWQAAFGGLSAPDTDAYNVFNGRVDCQGYLSYEFGYPAHDLVLAFSGLDPELRYEVVLYGNFNDVVRSNNLTRVTLEGAVAYGNASSAGAVVSGPGGATTTTGNGYNITGQVARYLNVASGPDGAFWLRIPAATNEQSQFHLNALMLQARREAATLLRLMPGSAAGAPLVLFCSYPGFVLEEASSVNGPWQVSSNQNSVQLVAPASGCAFYRLRR